MNMNPLNGNAALSRISEGSRDASRHCLLQIGIAVNDHSRIPAKLQHNALLAGLPLELPTYSRASGKTQELNAIVRDQRSCIIIAQWKHAQSRLGPASLDNQSSQQKSAKRSL